MLTQVLWELEVKCLPTEIPEKIGVAIESMKIGDTIHVKNIVVPAYVDVLTDTEAIVFTLAAPRKIEEPTGAVPEGEEVSAEPEVIKKEKKEEEVKEEKSEQPAA